MAMRTQPVILVLVLVAVIIGGVVLLAKHEPAKPPVTPPSTPSGPTVASTPPAAQARQGLRNEALKLQLENKWCDAQAKWQEVLTSLNKAPDPQLKAEAQSNMKLAESRCSPPRPLVSERKITSLPPDKRPAEVPEERLIRFYKVGRTVRSLAYLNITGEGSNTRWIVQHNAHFAYQYRVVAETKVTDNAGTRIVVEQSFPEIVQLRAVSKDTLELRLPDSPILAAVWKELESNVLEYVPVYVAVRKAGAIATSVDPHLRNTLTSFWEALGRPGFQPDPNSEIGLVVRLDKFNGTRLRLEYVNGLGVTEIKVLKGPKFDPDDLERLAYGSSLLMDYFVSQATDKAVGQTTQLRARDVTGLLSFGYDYEVEPTSHVDVKRIADTKINGVPLEALEVTGGDVSVQVHTGGGRRSAQFRPLPGIIRYSPDQLLVREARLAWQANTEWVSEDHLLFGTEDVSNLKVDNYYEADVVK